MNINYNQDDVIKIWNDLKSAHSNNAVHKRISDISPLDIYFSMDKDGSAGLMTITVNQPDTVGHKFSVFTITTGKRVDGSYAMTVTLKNKEFINEFAKLCSIICIDSYNESKMTDSANFIIEKIISWQKLFDTKKSQRLSIAEQIGLFGELITLELLLLKNSEDAVIESWKGPKGASQDFQFTNLLIECKTILSTSTEIKISSLDQLDIQLKRLYLQVHTIEEDKLGLGISLDQKVKTINERISRYPLPIAKFDALLIIYGYSKETDYSSPTYVLKNSKCYLVDAEFPRIARSKISNAISAGQYLLRLSSLTQFVNEGPFNGTI